MVTTDENDIRLLLDDIYVRYHYDFRHYSMTSLRRRLESALQRLGFRSYAELHEAILRDMRSFSQLLNYLTVQVSDMFRDPSYYRALREAVVPLLRTYPSLKVWIPGCSTGEEVYSFAILFKEEGIYDRTIFYATDINPEALQKAEKGIYPLDRVATFTENHQASGATRSLSEWYMAAYGSAMFDRSLRENVVFSDHSLATDSVFAEVHLVSCRNVLIYFDRELQDRALGLMKESLCRRGFLGLGSKETVRFSAHGNAFSEMTPEQRWFRRT